LGTISYGIYLWHGAVYPQMERLAVWGNAPVDVGLLAAVSVAFATASWFLIERPALRLKGAASAPVTERAPTAPPVAGMAI
jgi:peptidoglycan/LPS O-acetylase OafA/YrhL